MEIKKIIINIIYLYLSVVIFIISCDIKLINRDIELTGTPCYFSEEFARIYYRYDSRTSIGIGSGGIIYKIFWNDSIIVQKNDTMKYEIIRLIPKPKRGVPWTYTGYMEKSLFEAYSIDTLFMKQLDLSDYPAWERHKKYYQENRKKRP